MECNEIESQCRRNIKYKKNLYELQSQIQIVDVKHESQFCHDLQPHATDL
jgi:hypothetical protein